MYLVRNITQGKVIIGDLNLILVHNEAKDLDALYSRALIESSINLKHALTPTAKRPAALVLECDDGNPPKNSVHTTVFEAIDPSTLADLVKEQIAQQILHIASPSKDTPPDAMAEMQKKLDKLLEVMQKGVNTSKPQHDESESKLDDDKIVDIHKRTIDRLTRNAVANVEAKKDIKTDTDVDKKANELEGLI